MGNRVRGTLFKNLVGLDVLLMTVSLLKWESSKWDSRVSGTTFRAYLGIFVLIRGTKFGIDKN